jgi:phosphoglycolate phosphatase
MDGTLINSGSIIVNTINYVRTNTGLKPMDKKILLKNINNPNINPALFFYEVVEFTPRHRKLFDEYYNKNCNNDIELYDGIYELLENLQNRCTLTIATNASKKFALSMTKHLKIDHFFIDIAGYDLVKNPKPKPDMINYLIKKHNFIKKDTILVGDGQKDILSAKSAGIDSILVNWGFSEHDDDAILEVCDLQDKLSSWLG